MGFGFKIKRASISEYYTAENGDHLSITIKPDDSAVLIACKPVNNKLYFRKEYKTRKGAVVAMGKRFGKCDFNCMTTTHVKEVLTNGNGSTETGSSEV